VTEMTQAFDNKKYLTKQKDALLKRVSKFSKLYLEIGGKLIFDGHASRVLPGYDGKNKLNMLKELGSIVEVLYCINAKELEKGNTWSDTGLTLDKLAMKETKALKRNKIKVLGIVLTRFSGEKSAIEFKRMAKKKGINVFFTKEISGYPENMKKVFGKNGFKSQDAIKTTRKIIAVTGAGAGSGKMFLCMSQIYSDDKKGIDSGYAKFETFPIWNLSLDHPVNLAYEAATADLGDKNRYDVLHQKAYGIKSVNYNRDIENFVLLKKIIKQFIPKQNFMHSYKSPTDMGINMAKEGIADDAKIREAAVKEILRRKKFFTKRKMDSPARKKILERIEKIIEKIKK
jgi:uncharacterized protein (UPF0371 family)